MDIIEFEDRVIAAEGEQLVAMLATQEALDAFNAEERTYHRLKESVILLVAALEMGNESRAQYWADRIRLAIRKERVSLRDAAQSIISDEQLDLWKEDGVNIGFQRASEPLRELEPSQRPVAVHEANARMGLAPGWNFSGAVWQAVKDLQNGQTPCLDENAELIRSEQAKQVR